MVAALLLAGTQVVAAQQIDTLALRAHTRFLAADALEGRGVGTAGERIAALYIESELRRMGVRPGPGRDGYIQPLPLRRATIDSARMVVREGADSAQFGADDFLLNTGGEGALRSFAGAAVFLGTAEHALAANDQMLAGKVIVLLGTLGADAATLVPRWLAAGVRGTVVLV
ncbi:MAG TPA: hypothetical protein VK864_18430, partial [Longimicrobiales bacterium]|nr:hypothetical protein [Longimicrobiales bacterium]